MWPLCALIPAVLRSFARSQKADIVGSPIYWQVGWLPSSTAARNWKPTPPPSADIPLLNFPSRRDPSRREKIICGPVDGAGAPNRVKALVCRYEQRNTATTGRPHRDRAPTIRLATRLGPKPRPVLVDSKGRAHFRIYGRLRSDRRREVSDLAFRFAPQTVDGKKSQTRASCSGTQRNRGRPKTLRTGQVPSETGGSRRRRIWDARGASDQ